MNSIASTPRCTVVAGAILSALAASFATVSSAAGGTTPPQVIVKYVDLDASTSKDAVALYSRIHSAAVNVCSRTYESDGLAYKLNKDDCLQKAIGDAVTQIKRPALSTVFASKYGIPQPVVLAAAKAR